MTIAVLSVTLTTLPVLTATVLASLAATLSALTTTVIASLTTVAGSTPALVALGGATGATARYLLTARVSGRRGVVVVNTFGSGLLGALLPLVDESAAAFVGVGFCGAFTTFSTVAVETYRLYAADDRRAAVRFAVGVAVAAFVAAGFGATLASWLVTA